jgi:hypothetical protein
MSSIDVGDMPSVVRTNVFPRDQIDVSGIGPVRTVADHSMTGGSDVGDGSAQAHSASRVYARGPVHP